METFGREARVVFPIRNAVATRYPPVATWTLVAINCAVFLLQLSLGPGELEQFLSTYAVIPARYFYPDAFADGPQDLVPFLHHDVPAWRLAAPDSQHVDAVAVRRGRRGSDGV
jgi:membrane associated rhomboid family serine protease